MTTIINRFRRWLHAVAIVEQLERELRDMAAENSRRVMQIADRDHDNEVLGDSNQQLQQENLRLQDRLDACLADRSRLWDLMENSINGERQAYQMHVNQAWQGRGAGVPFPAAPHLPEREPNEGGHMTLHEPPSQRVHNRTIKFAQAIIDKVKESR